MDVLIIDIDEDTHDLLQDRAVKSLTWIISKAWECCITEQLGKAVEHIREAQELINYTDALVEDFDFLRKSCGLPAAKGNHLVNYTDSLVEDFNFLRKSCSLPATEGDHLVQPSTEPAIQTEGIRNVSVIAKRNRKRKAESTLNFLQPKQRRNLPSTTFQKHKRRKRFRNSGFNRSESVPEIDFTYSY